MDKKNVQNENTWIFYEKGVDCEHNEKLASGRQKNNFHFVTINFPEKYYGIFCVNSVVNIS